MNTYLTIVKYAYILNISSIFVCTISYNTIHIIYSNIMKKRTLLVPTALCLAFTLPIQGHKTNHVVAPDTPDTLATDTFVSDSIDDNYTEDDDWATGDDDNAAADTLAADSVEDASEFCTFDDNLLPNYDTENADYSQLNKKDSNASVTFSATLFKPSKEKYGELKVNGGYNLMASHILAATLDSAAAAKWKVEPLDKMFENKWKAVKTQYNTDMAEMAKFAEGGEMPSVSYSFHTTITPAWQWADKHLTTYGIEDETYLGGAHGMLYQYCLTLNEQTDSLMGLTDIFKEEALPEVFKLVGEKLKTGPQAANDEDTWPSVAEVVPAPNANDYSVLSGQMQLYKGKWYPRPALTECGVVFTYPPYVKNCYAAGTINILLNYSEVKDWLK